MGRRAGEAVRLWLFAWEETRRERKRRERGERKGKMKERKGRKERKERKTNYLYIGKGKELQCVPE